MAFASSLFCSSKFLEHTHTLTKCLTVLACSDNTKDVRTSSVFDYFFYVKILVGDIEGGATKTFFFFCCWAQFLPPPSEWRPRRPPIPPVGKTAPAHTVFPRTGTQILTPTPDLCQHTYTWKRSHTVSSYIVCVCVRACVCACVRACARACARACERACVRACVLWAPALIRRSEERRLG